MRTIAIAALWWACGGTAPPPRGAAAAIEAIRARAAAHPNDPAALFDLAAGEMLVDGGDARRARAAIDAARARSPRDPALAWLSGIEHDQHARPAEALAAFVEATTRATEASDPRASAIAEVSLERISQLAEIAPRWRETVVPLAERLVADPAAVGPVRDQALSVLLSEAFRKGDVALARRLADGAGCVRTWRVAGPFGPLAFLGFDETLAAEGRGPLAASYDLGPGRGARPTRDVVVNGCYATFGSGTPAGPGGHVAEAFVELPRGGDWVLRVETAKTVRVSIDGTEVLRVDRRSAPAPEVLYRRVRLQAGRREVEVEIATRMQDPHVTLSLSPAPDARTFDPPSGATPLDVFLRTTLARVRRDPLGAREEGRALDTPRATTAVLELLADVALDDPMTPSDQRQDLARGRLRRVVESDPAAWYSPFRLALLDPRAPESLRALREVADRWPALPQVQLSLAATLRERGFEADAMRAIRRAREALPEGCDAVDAEREALFARGRRTEARALEGRLLECSAESEARLRRLLAQRNWADAWTEVGRLEDLVPEHLRQSEARTRLQIARAKRDGAATRDAIARLARFAGVPGFPLDEADTALAAGRRAEAIAALDAGLRRDPQGLRSLRPLRRALAGGDEMTPWRIDGARVLREFEASGRTYEEGEVLVLDSTVARVLPDHSAIELVHQIYRVQSQESVDRRGQVRLPGTILTLRVIKPDGRRVEPDLGDDESETISLAGLTPGDYVEWEYLVDRDALSNGGWRLDSWWFQSFETPFDLSRLTVVVPAGTALDVETNGGLPAATESTGPDGSRVLRWEMRESRPRREEPGSAAIEEILPNVRLGIGADWRGYVDSIRDGLSDRDRVDPAVQRLVRTVLGDAADAPAADRIRILHRWVAEHLEPGGEFYGDAASMIATKTGHPARVLRYLLTLAGLRAELVAVRPFGSIPPSAVADPDLYSMALVRVREGDGPPTFVWASDDLAPVGYMPPALRGQEGIVYGPGAERVQMPEAPPDTDARDVEIDVQVRADGSAALDVVETHRGMLAVSWRERLERIADAELERGMAEGYVPIVVPGGTLRTFALEGKTDPDAPIVLRYSVDAAVFGRRVGNRLVVPPLFANGLVEAAASLPARTTAQVLADVATRVRMRIRPARGASLGPPPANADLRGPGGSTFTLRARRERDALVVERKVQLRRLRLEPTQYPAWAEFCRRVDAGEASDVSVVLGR